MNTTSDSGSGGKGKRDISPIERCLGSDICPNCPWLIEQGGSCPGCDGSYHQGCVKQRCELHCDDCGCGEGSRIPGYCGRMAIVWPEGRESLQELFEAKVPYYMPEPLPLYFPLIPVIYPEIRDYRIPVQFPQIDAWAVPIDKVADLEGRFYSEDLKDYLMLSPGRKLILYSGTSAAYRLMLWEKGHQIDYKRYRINYWIPAYFPILERDAKLNQFAQTRRQQLHTIQIQSQFVWFRLGENVPVEFLAPLREAASALIMGQDAHGAHSLAALYDEVQLADWWFPPYTAFFIVGSVCDLPISKQRLCYEINSAWLERALAGRNLSNEKEPGLSRAELLTVNLEKALARVYADMARRRGTAKDEPPPDAPEEA